MPPHEITNQGPLHSVSLAQSLASACDASIDVMRSILNAMHATHDSNEPNFASFLLERKTGAQHEVQ